MNAQTVRIELLYTNQSEDRRLTVSIPESDWASISCVDYIELVNGELHPDFIRTHSPAVRAAMLALANGESAILPKTASATEHRNYK